MRHALTSNAIPAHTGTREAALELLDATFNGTGAGGEAIFAERVILHAALVVGKVMRVLGQASLVEPSGNVVTRIT